MIFFSSLISIFIGIGGPTLAQNGGLQCWIWSYRRRLTTRKSYSVTHSYTSLFYSNFASKWVYSRTVRSKNNKYYISSDLSSIASQANNFNILIKTMPYLNLPSHVRKLKLSQTYCNM